MKCFLVVWGITPPICFTGSCFEPGGVAPALDGTNNLVSLGGLVRLTGCLYELGIETFFSYLFFVPLWKTTQQSFMDRIFERMVNTRKRKYLCSDFSVALNITCWPVTAYITANVTAELQRACAWASRSCRFPCFHLFPTLVFFLMTKNCNFL